MTIPKTVVTRLAQQHPHSAVMLKAFVPLLEAQNSLADNLPPITLPVLDTVAFAQGKAWLPSLSAEPEQYFDKAFLKEGPKQIVAAAMQGLPELEEEFRALGTFLAKRSGPCLALIALPFKGQVHKARAWATQYGFHEDAATLLAMHCAAAAAKRVDKAAEAIELPPWGRSYCPICGNRPHGSCIKGKEGKRFLQCSLCRHEWPFPRTICPICEQDSLQELPVFFLEEKKYERAEGCNKCKHYILSLDMRELTEDAPLELYLLCMVPLDLLMQEKDFIPGASAG